MKIQIDGGDIVEVGTVKIIIEDVSFNDRLDEADEGTLRIGELHTTYNDTGVIVDLIQDDEIVATTVHLHDDAAQNTWRVRGIW